MKLSIAESINWIKSRRSVYPKMFDPNASVTESELIDLFEAARWAPNHKLTQPWRFIVHVGEGIDALTTKQVEIIKSSNLDANAQTAKIDKLSQKAKQSVAVAAIVMKRGDEKRIPEWEEISAVACAMQNVFLHAQSIDLVGYWSTGCFTNHAEIRRYLEIKPFDQHLGWYYLGRLKSESFSKRIRKETEEFVEFRRG